MYLQRTIGRLHRQRHHILSDRRPRFVGSWGILPYFFNPLLPLPVRVWKARSRDPGNGGSGNDISDVYLVAVTDQKGPPVEGVA
jgi:hypothetical protein